MATKTKETLEIVFNLIDGRTSIMSIPDPKSGLTAADIETLTNVIVDKQIFSVKGVLISGVKDFYLRLVNVTTLG